MPCPPPNGVLPVRTYRWFMPTDAIAPVHRRIWRLAFLLTGNGRGATDLIERIRRLRKDPSTLEPSLLDRLIIQNARSIKRADRVNLPTSPSTPFGVSGPATEAMNAALRLPRQPLEAWVLRRLDDLDDLHIARAMDCSKSAAKVHLSAADEVMSARLGPGLPAAVDALRRFADSIDPEPVILAHREEARRERKVRVRNLALIIGAVLLVALYIILRVLVP
jgi:DNA-directed RNA polymerase specialized sigma24 family protein